MHQNQHHSSEDTVPIEMDFFTRKTYFKKWAFGHIVLKKIKRCGEMWLVVVEGKEGEGMGKMDEEGLNFN